ncbi:MAG: sulfatase-like hydrolase/transferase, partial [Pseudomonadota bacterium]
MTRPNIVWVVVDHMAFHGHYRTTELDYHWPRLEAIAREGAWFERAYATVPVCTPARASLMSGQRAGRHGLRWNPEYDILQNRPEFLPEQQLFNHGLATVGYNTHFVGKWHCGHNTVPSDYGMPGWSLPDYGNVYASAEYKRYLSRLGLEQPRCTLDHNLFDPTLDGTEIVLDPAEPWTY